MGEIWQLVDARNVGGIERHVCELTLALMARQLPARVVLCSTFGSHPFADLLHRDNIPLEILDGTLRHLYRAMRRARPTLVHTHGYKAGILGRLAARMLGIPVVSSFHAGERSAWPVSLYQQIDAYTSVLGKRIAISTEIARQLPVSAKKIDNFVNLPDIDHSIRPPTSVAFVGRLSHEKGPDLFCEIARRYGPSVEWHVFGDGPLRAELERTYGSIVRFHGHCADMSSVWPRVGLLLMSSRAEGLPMAALEAMARGIPVAAARVGGLPNLIEPVDPALAFEAGSVAEAEHAVRHWHTMSDANALELRSTCRKRIEEHYSPAAAVPQFLEVYRSAGCPTDFSTTRIVQSSICSSGEAAFAASPTKTAAASTSRA